MIDQNAFLQLASLLFGGGILLGIAKLLISFGEFKNRISNMEKTIETLSAKIDLVYREIIVKKAQVDFR